MVYSPHLMPTKTRLILLLVLAFLVACAPKSTPTPTPTDPSAQMDLIQAQVAAIRSLPEPPSLSRQSLTPDELQKTVATDFFADYTPSDAVKDARSLWLLGLLPKDFDLLDFYHKLYAEQIAGFYDDEKKAMFIVQGADFNVLQRTTFAHEYTHAIQDFNFDFTDKLGYTDESCEEDSEKCAALQALIEGDATLTESLWFSAHNSSQDITELQNYSLISQSPVFDSAPAFMRENLTFPYFQGGAFVKSLHAQGGFAAIDRAFTTQPPLSSEHILHPSRYPDDHPLKVELPDPLKSLGSDWQIQEDNVIGEWFTWLLLARGDQSDSRLNDTVASAAAEGWGGDRYLILENSASREFALILRYVWDTPADQHEAAKAFADWLMLRFGEPSSDAIYKAQERFAALLPADNYFTLIFAENPNTLQALIPLLK